MKHHGNTNHPNRKLERLAYQQIHPGALQYERPDGNDPGKLTEYCMISAQFNNEAARQMLNDGSGHLSLNNILYRPGSIFTISIPSGSKNFPLWRMPGIGR
jgi:hypothetical protein